MASVKDLPHKVKGFVLTDGFDEGIVLNAHCSYEQQFKTHEHECEHLKENDAFREDMTADEIEAIRHGE